MKFFLFFLVTFALETQARSVSDSIGTVITLNQKPERIVALAPSVGELVSLFLEQDQARLVGVSEYSDYPKWLSEKPVIGPYAHVVIEKIVSLKPTLCLAAFEGNQRDQIQRLQGLGIPVFVLKAERIADIPNALRMLGQVLWDEKRGESFASAFMKKLDVLQKNAQGLQIEKSLIQVGRAPMVFVGGGSFLNDGLETIGVRNLFSGTSESYPRPGIEAVVSKKPQWVFILGHGDPTMTAKIEEDWSEWGKKFKLPTRVIALNDPRFLRPTPRILDALDDLQQTLRKSSTKPVFR